MDSVFSQANISPTQGTELLMALGLDAWDIQKPDVFKKYIEVAKYLEKFGDGAHIARTVGRNSIKGDRLDKVLEYVALRKHLEEVRTRKSELPKNGMIKDEAPEVTQQRMEIETKERALINEISMYE